MPFVLISVLIGYHSRATIYCLQQFTGRLATRVLVVAPMTFMMMQQRTRTIWTPKLMITNFARLEKNVKGESDCKDAKFYHFIH